MIVVACLSLIYARYLFPQGVTEMGKGIRPSQQKETLTRIINEQRRILPYILEEFGKRMDTEYVIVFQKS